jgi:diacylglycerol kinase
MIWATALTIALALFLLKKRKIKEFCLFLAIMFVLLFPSFNSFIESNINLPIRQWISQNHEYTKILISSLPSIIKLINLVFLSISVSYFVYVLILKIILTHKKQQLIQPIKCNKHKPSKKIGFIFTFKKPNEKITA